MNCKDIEAARKLIAQFEDRADGRHNSTRLAWQSNGSTIANLRERYATESQPKPSEAFH